MSTIQMNLLGCFIHKTFGQCLSILGIQMMRIDGLGWVGLDNQTAGLSGWELRHIGKPVVNNLKGTWHFGLLTSIFQSI